MKRWIFLAVLAVLLSWGCGSSEKGKTTEEGRPEDYGPAVMMVFHQPSPLLARSWREHVAGFPLTNFPLVEEGKRFKLGACAYSVGATGGREGDLSFSAVRRPAKEGEVVMDMQIGKGKVVIDLKGIRYCGEEYLPLYHGDNWIIAIVRDHSVASVCQREEAGRKK